MTRGRVALLLVGAIAGGFVAGSLYTERERVSAADLGSRRVLHYVDPMHPAYTSDKPGTAPDCGMKLEPVYADGRAPAHGIAASPGEVSISPEAQRLIGVKVGAVEKRAVTERLRLTGQVATDETRVYRINLGIDAAVRELAPATTGSRVSKGQWLATIAAPDARSALQSYIVALDVLDRTTKSAEGPGPITLATASMQQSVDRLLTLGVSQAQIDEMARTRQLPLNLTISAPEDGVVVSRNVSVGQKLQRGEELFRIADLRRVWILADVLGRDAELVHAGLTAGISIPDRPRRFHGIISRDIVQFDANNQSVRLRIDVHNPELLLQPGMFVDVEVPVVLPPALVVPVDAVIHSGRKTMVFVERRPGVFERTDVVTGWHFAPYVEIVNGLAEGDRVVVAGTFLVDSESRLRHGRTVIDGRR
jgi:Cu(I)/Ag(I) efflux system membrane fusion protein